MQTEDSQKIIGRFFDTLEYLKNARVIRGLASFTKQHGINRRNLHLLRKNLASDIFQPAWLTYLVRDYNVSPTWLLTGEGDILRKRPGRKPASDKHGKAENHKNASQMQ